MSAGAGEVVLTMHEIRCRIEHRADETRRGPGRLTGILIRFGEIASDRRERFATDSLHWPDDGIVLRRQHARSAPIMRITPRVEGDAVIIDQQLPDTVSGRDAAAEIRAGLFSGLSVEFKAERERQHGGIREIERAALVGCGLVDEPSYGSATVELRGRGGRRRVWL